MSQKEHAKIAERIKEINPNKKRLYRINAGKTWIASPKDTSIVKSINGGLTVHMRNARRFNGAPKGWPDLAGFESVTITPDMVGKKIAVFVGEEVKVTGTLNLAQKAFRDVLVKLGGIFRVIRS